MSEARPVSPPPSASGLARAVWHKDFAEVTARLRDGEPSDAKDDEGFTPLMTAAGLGAVAIVELLLAAGADPNRIDSRMGGAPLHRAAQGDAAEVGRLLLDHGALIDLQSPLIGHTALIDAVLYTSRSMVALLLDRGARTKLTSALLTPEFGATALDLARFRGDAHIIRLIEARQSADDVGIATQALIAAAKRGDAKAVGELLDAGAEVDQRAPMATTPDDGHTPLIVAARDGHLAVVAALMNAGADPMLYDGMKHSNPLTKAAANGHLEIAMLLCQLAPDALRAQIPYNGLTPIHDAVLFGHGELAEVYARAGANLSVRTHSGEDAAAYAERYGLRELAAAFARSPRRRQCLKTPTPPPHGPISRPGTGMTPKPSAQPSLTMARSGT